MVENQYLTLDEVADKLKISVRTVNRWIEEFNFPVLISPSGVKRFIESDIDSWMRGTMKGRENGKQ